MPLRCPPSLKVRPSRQVRTNLAPVRMARAAITRQRTPQRECGWSQRHLQLPIKPCQLSRGLGLCSQGDVSQFRR